MTAVDAPCDVCGGAGFMWNHGYSHASVPGGHVPVQRCDACQVYDGDEAAAHAALAHRQRIGVARPGDVVVWVEDPRGLPGDWCIRRAAVAVARPPALDAARAAYTVLLREWLRGARANDPELDQLLRDTREVVHHLERRQHLQVVT